MAERPIQKLSDEVIGQIAAGEVVERPAAAVKELVENSIDAGATAVTVEIRDGGVSYLRVSDNGKGIDASQIRMAFERHATSKLVSTSDLFDVHTLGFRGEALASVAAVSKVTCTTRAESAEYGVKAQVDAGVMTDLTEAASPVGTTLVVKELFYNAPVRLKFLKKPATEAALVSDYMMRLILSRPDVAFRFVNQGKTVYRSTGDGKLESAVYAIYGRDALREMKRVHGTMNGVVLDGYVGVGELSRGNRQQQSFFVNGRYFRDDDISRALENGCEGFVMVGRFPCCVLSLEMPYGLVDVNVHPNKLEVRFQNVGGVTQAVQQLVSDALNAETIRERLAGAVARPVAPKPSAPIEVVRLQEKQPAATVQRPADSPTNIPADSPDADASQSPAENKALVRHDVPVSADDAPKATPSALSAGETSVAHNASDNSLSAPEIDMPALSANPFEESTASAPQSVSVVPLEASPAASADSSASPLSQPTQDESLQDGYRPLAQKPADAVLREPALAFDESEEAEMPAPLAIPVIAAMPVEEEQQALPIAPKEVEIRYIGAAFKTYLLFEVEERLLLVDQHAAHERVLYDRFMKRYEGEKISQQLLTPQLLRLTARDCALLADMQDALTDAGFDVELFDETSVAVRAVPVILGENAPVREMLTEAMEEWQSQRTKVTRERLRRRVMQMACKHAIKGGDVLSSEDVRQLLRQMLQTGVQPTCPHGRPIVIEMTRRDLEKRFKRVQ